MAKVIVNTPPPAVRPPKTYTLELTESEANCLELTLLNTHVEDEVDTVWEALNDAGIVGSNEFKVREENGGLVLTRRGA